MAGPELNRDDGIAVNEAIGSVLRKIARRDIPDVEKKFLLILAREFEDSYYHQFNELDYLRRDRNGRC